MKSLLILLAFVSFAERGIAQNAIKASQEKVSFTLLNKSIKDIPLIIPGYMNPNLSPMSNSGVTVRIGQEVYFRYKGKKRLLFIATAEMEGERLVVNKLIKAKKKEISKK